MGCPILPSKYVVMIMLILVLTSLIDQVGLAEDDVEGYATWFLTVGGKGAEISGNSIVLDDSGDIYFTGTTISWSNTTKALLSKTDPIGRVIFTIVFGGIKDDEAYDITVNGTDAYIVGATQSFGSGGKDSFIAKINRFGEIEWFLVLGGDKADVLRAIENYSGKVLYVTGYTRSFGEGSSDVLVAKITSEGELLWVMTFGGAKAEEAYDLCIDEDGNIYVVGRTASYGFGLYDVFVAKILSTGKIAWFKIIGTRENELASSITIDDDGNIYVTGWIINTTTDTRDVFIAKLDPLNGEVVWIKSFGGEGEDVPYGITCSENTVYVTGITTSFLTTQGDQGDMFVLALDSSTGDANWLLLIGGTEYDMASAIYVDKDSVYLTGSSSSFSSGSTDLTILRLENMFIDSLHSTKELTWVSEGFQNNVLVKKISGIKLSTINPLIHSATYIPRKSFPTVSIDYPRNVFVKPVIPYTYIATPTGEYPVEVKTVTETVTDTVIETKTVTRTETIETTYTYTVTTTYTETEKVLVEVTTINIINVTTITTQATIATRTITIPYLITTTYTVTDTVTSTRTIVETSFVLDLTTLLGISTIVLGSGIIAGYMLGKDLLYTYVLSRLKKSRRV